MTKHKWHEEIKAWADGAEIERRKLSAGINWEPFNGHWATGFDWEYRIKPQPKEPQYLYVYFGNRGYGYHHFISDALPMGMQEYEYRGKIPLIVESNND